MSKVNEEKILQRPTYTLNSTVVLAYSGLLTAVSILLACIYPIPLFTDFLLYEPSDVPIILGGIFLGLGPGLLITTVTSIIMAIITGHGGPIGIVMHIISTGILVSMITIFYRKGDSKGRYLMGAIIGVLGTTVAMALNSDLTPMLGSTCERGCRSPMASHYSI